ncbi:hypothetical protein V1478_010634 [Vespula squamosa]|uniref:Uncharacterized protein n=1 Tax=Vespula squamosa TaxID=30214 RepID=A0ABD2AIC5_VESSQ
MSSVENTVASGERFEEKVKDRMITDKKDEDEEDEEDEEEEEEEEEEEDRFFRSTNGGNSNMAGDRIRAESAEARAIPDLLCSTCKINYKVLYVLKKKKMNLRNNTLYQSNQQQQQQQQQQE